MKNNRLLTVLTLALTALFFAGAFAFYPGSTYYDSATTGYSLWGNSLSETGATINYRHEPVTVSRWLFTAAVISFGLAVYLLFGKHNRTQKQRVLTLVTVLLFFAIPALPADRWPSLHNYAFFAAAVGLALNFAVQAYFNRARSFLPPAFVLLSYVGFLLVFPNPSASPEIRLAHIVLQKAVFVITSLFMVRLAFAKKP